MDKDHKYFIGLMSGTSMDGLNGCLIEIKPHQINTVTAAQSALDPDLKRTLHALCSSGMNELEQSAKAAAIMAGTADKLVYKLLRQSGLKAQDIIAIGSHGQTVRHCPQDGFSVQIDDAPRLAALTGIDVISNFRAADLCRGGEGAPLTPIFHQLVLSSPDEARFILNLGGIANLTVLKPGGNIAAGFDCGPANTLIDLSCRLLCGQTCDYDGKLAFKGRVNQQLLKAWLSHPYFAQKPPKSTGRELFNADFIAAELKFYAEHKEQIPDLIATLSQLTVKICVNEILRFKAQLKADKSALILCGGGVHNPYLQEQFKNALKPYGIETKSAADLGIDPDYMEAAAFAYFAYCFTQGRTLPLHQVTGASADGIAGMLSPANQGFFVSSRNHHHEYL